MMSEKGVLVWQVLVATAMERRIITYGDIGKAIDHAAVGIGPLLEELAEHLRARRLPHLTVLAVNRDTGRPSYDYEGIYGIDVDVERQRVFGHNWLRELPPPIEH